MLCVHVIELDLTKVPVPEPEYLLKHLIVVVKGKSQFSDFSLALVLLQQGGNFQFHHFCPGTAAQAVEQIEVHIVPVQPFQLGMKELLRLLPAVHQPAGQLRGQIVALPGVLLQGLP